MYYLYAFIPSCPKLLLLENGLVNRPLKTVEHEEVALVFSEIEHPKINQQMTHLAMTHGKVIEWLFQNNPVIPLRFGMLCNSLNECKTILQKHYDKIYQELERLTGVVEIGMSMFINPPRSASNNGTEYLLNRYELWNQQNEISNKLYSVVKELVIEFKPADFDDHSQELNYLFLVAKQNQKFFLKTIAEIKFPAQIRLSGPWAPYNFCSLEFNNA